MGVDPHRQDVDFVLHVGDFIYEISSEGGFSYPDRQIELPSGSPVAITLEDYRYLYRLYRADPFLQEALAQHTFIYTWDDHETADNCYWDYAADTLGVEPDHPLAGNPGECLQLKLDARRGERVGKLPGAGVYVSLYVCRASEYAMTAWFLLP